MPWGEELFSCIKEEFNPKALFAWAPGPLTRQGGRAPVGLGPELMSSSGYPGS
jgi:hypothetical protein